MAFKSGYDPNRNIKGAPKKEFRRDDFTEQFFLDNKECITAVGDMILAQALRGDDKSQERIWNKFFTAAKSRDNNDSDDHARLKEELSKMPNEKLVKIQEILLEQMKVEGEG